MLMSNAAISHPKKPGPTRITLRSLAQKLDRLRQRVEDLEDLRELNEAIARNNGKALIPWTQAKRDLQIE